MKTFPACIELGTILRHLDSDWRDNGIICSIKRAYAWGYADKLWNRREAVSVAFRASMEQAEAWGHGNRAARRIKHLSASHKTQLSIL